MKSLPPPSFTVQQVVSTCIASIRDAGLSAALNELLPTFHACEAEFTERAVAGELFRIAGVDHVGGRVTKAQMQWLYKSKLSRKDSGARKYYDLIMMSPTHGVCPLCAQRLVATVDHYLPQDSFSQLTVTPANLLPACIECNFLKRAGVARQAEEQSLHPYFDRLPDGIWLRASIVATAPPTVMFRANPPFHWPEILRRRVERHFELFELGKLYASNAASELVDIALALEEVFRSGGSTAVADHLATECRSREANDVNSWKSGLYRAMVASHWFHAEGFLTIR